MKRIKKSMSCLGGSVPGRIWIAVLCLFLTASLSACGGGDDITDDTKNNTDTPDDNKETTKTEYKGGVTTEAAEQNTPSGWTAVSLPQLPTLTAANVLNITDYGASTSSTDNTEAIQKALDAVPETGGEVYVPKGEWLCGPVKMKSKTILYLADGATLKLLPFETYPYTTDSDGKRQYANFIDCYSNATDIIVEGESKTGSVIDGQGAEWWNHVKADDGNDVINMKRGAVIRFSSGQRFLIKNFTVKNAPGVNLTISDSGKASHGTIHDMIISEPASDAADPSHNTDGIAIWGPYVNIYNCDISNGDDNVVVDSNGQYVHVWDCQFGYGHGASIGSYTVNVHDILYEDITFSGTESGFRLKSQRGRSGDVYNITCRNCTMKNVNNPVYIECWYNLSTKPIPSEATAETKTSTTPAFRNILLQNITSTGTPYNTSVKGYFPIYIYGLPESYIKNVTFDNVQIEAQKGMFLAFCDGVVFKNGCKITNSKSANNLIATAYEANISGDYGKVETNLDGEDASYTLDADAATTNGTTTSDTKTYSFGNGITITNDKSKTYATGQNSTIKYSANVTYTINLPTGFTATSVTFEGYDNYTDVDAYISEVNGVSFASDKYVFPKDKSTVTRTVTLDNPASGSFSFTPGGKQICVKITINGKKS